MIETCENCRYGNPLGGGVIGCRRYPPSLVDNDIQRNSDTAVWPLNIKGAPIYGWPTVCGSMFILRLL